MKSLFHFFKYNNILPIAISFALLGSASAFAAANPDTVIQSKERIVAIDNTYIAELDLDRYTPTVEVLAVTEDGLFYYVDYNFSTIALVDSVWQDITTKETMVIEKARSGAFRDLGLYVTEELNELIASEKKRLQETQLFEQNQISTKKVVTEYDGIVGQFLSEDVTEFEGYEPVIKPPKPKQEVESFARPPKNPPKPLQPKPEVVPLVREPEVEPEVITTEETPVILPTTDTTNGGSTTGSGYPATANQPPVLTILGNNPVVLEVGGAYTDLGATAIDDRDSQVVINVYIAGELVQFVALDTTIPAVYSIVYEAIDSEGEASSVERVVRVQGQSTLDNNPTPEATSTPEVEPTVTPSTTTSLPPEPDTSVETDSITVEPVLVLPTTEQTSATPEPSAVEATGQPAAANDAPSDAL